MNLLELNDERLKNLDLDGNTLAMSHLARKNRNMDEFRTLDKIKGQREQIMDKFADGLLEELKSLRRPDESTTSLPATPGLQILTPLMSKYGKKKKGEQIEIEPEAKRQQEEVDKILKAYESIKDPFEQYQKAREALKRREVQISDQKLYHFIKQYFKNSNQDRLITFEQFSFNCSDRCDPLIRGFLKEIRFSRKKDKIFGAPISVTELWSKNQFVENLKLANFEKDKNMLMRYSSLIAAKARLRPDKDKKKGPKMETFQSFNSSPAIGILNKVAQHLEVIKSEEETRERLLKKKSKQVHEFINAKLVDPKVGSNSGLMKKTGLQSSKKVPKDHLLTSPSGQEGANLLPIVSDGTIVEETPGLRRIGASKLRVESLPTAYIKTEGSERNAPNSHHLTAEYKFSLRKNTSPTAGETTILSNLGSNPLLRTTQSVTKLSITKPTKQEASKNVQTERFGLKTPAAVGKQIQRKTESNSFFGSFKTTTASFATKEDSKFAATARGFQPSFRSFVQKQSTPSSQGMVGKEFSVTTHAGTSEGFFKRKDNLLAAVAGTQKQESGRGPKLQSLAGGESLLHAPMSKSAIKLIPSSKKLTSSQTELAALPETQQRNPWDKLEHIMDTATALKKAVDRDIRKLEETEQKVVLQQEKNRKVANLKKQLQEFRYLN